MSQKEQNILESCASFELRGPHTSLSRVSNGRVAILKESTDWGSIVGDRPVKDMRTTNLADLFPSAADMFSAMVKAVSADAAPSVTPKPRGPRMG